MSSEWTKMVTTMTEDALMNVVTGASSGIGKGVTLALAERGERVVAVARRAAVLHGLATASDGLIQAVPADVTTVGGRQSVVEAVAGVPIRSLTHAAGSLVQLGSWIDLQPDELESHLAVHVAAPIALSSALLQKGVVGRVAFIDSYSSTTPRVGWSAYSIVKAAAQMSARSAASELAGTRVVRVFPGAVDTPLLQTIINSQAPAADAYRSIREAGHVSDPIDIGREIADLLLNADDGVLDATESWTVGHPA
jgi:NAD(P)-dependent dehydrogenase (short-subunit alcohol dehydrogenase family)